MVHSDAGREACLYVAVKINIKATQRSSEQLYSSAAKHSVSSPMLMDCRPSESPAFVHGRTTQAHFDLRFNTKPYSLGAVALHEQEDGHLGAHIHLKLSTVSIPDGVMAEVVVPPSRIEQSNKGYQEDQYHVGVTFDLHEYQDSATVKLNHAQLGIDEDDLVDGKGRKFTIAKKLASDGLPIYVYESNDIEQLVAEETDAVKQAYSDTSVGQESALDDPMGADVSTELSDLDEQIEKHRRAAVEAEQKIKCLCVHGTCREGQAACTGSCESGWTGNYCDVPSNSAKATVNKNRRKKDFTKDGLYRPMQIQEERRTGTTDKAAMQHQNLKEKASSMAQESPSRKSNAFKAKKIDGEVSASTSFVSREPVHTSLHDQEAVPYIP